MRFPDISSFVFGARKKTKFDGDKSSCFEGCCLTTTSNNELFSPNGSWLLALSVNGTIMRWINMNWEHRLHGDLSARLYRATRCQRHDRPVSQNRGHFQVCLMFGQNWRKILILLCFTSWKRNVFKKSELKATVNPIEKKQEPKLPLSLVNRSILISKLLFPKQISIDYSF